MSAGQGTEAGNPPGAETPGQIGARLMAGRKQRQLTVESVARQLRLDVSVINALESGDTRHLPAPIFVQGYLRSYARLLGLPEDELVSDYTRESGALPPLTVKRVNGRKSLVTLPSMRLLRNIILIVLAMILLWLAYPALNRMLVQTDQSEDGRSPGHLEIPPAEH